MISLEELARLAINKGVVITPDGHPAITFADWDDVAALVRAVQASFSLRDVMVTIGGGRKVVSALEQFDAALVPFREPVEKE